MSSRSAVCHLPCLILFFLSLLLSLVPSFVPALFYYFLHFLVLISFPCLLLSFLPSFPSYFKLFLSFFVLFFPSLLLSLIPSFGSYLSSFCFLPSSFLCILDFSLSSFFPLLVSLPFFSSLYLCFFSHFLFLFCFISLIIFPSFI